MPESDRGREGRVRGKVGESAGESNKDATAAWRAARVSNEGILSQRALALCSVLASCSLGCKQKGAAYQVKRTLQHPS